MNKIGEKTIGIIILTVIAVVIAYSWGKDAGRQEVIDEVTSEEVYISDCEGTGCYVNFPKILDLVFVGCDDAHYCISEPKTEEQRRKDEEMKNLFDEIIENAFQEIDLEE